MKRKIFFENLAKILIAKQIFTGHISLFDYYKNCTRFIDLILFSNIMITILKLLLTRIEILISKEFEM